jgi:signal transduction histidine kinase
LYSGAEDRFFGRIQAGPSGTLADEPSLYSSARLPCVFYECNAALEFIYVSENSFELLGLESRQLIGNSLLSEQRIPVEDLKMLSKRLAELGRFDNNKAAFVHRILDSRGLPLWVTHNFWKQDANDTTVRGCIFPVDLNGRVNSSEQAVISRFVHKIGNHFQLLNLVINSLKKTVPESRETLMLEETLEKAIELSRDFSDYNQVPTSLSRVELTDILQAAAVPRRSSFEKKGIAFDIQIHETLSGVVVQADPYLLELAIGHILQNALEATEAGGRVTLQANTKCAATASIHVIDSGGGIEENALTNVLVPFFTSKKNHEGLGLSMASRFIEIHGGILRIMSAKGKGTEVAIVLPTEAE